MAIVAKQGSQRQAIPEGSYAAICTRVIDLGDQENKMFGKTNRKIMLCWEIPECTIEVNGEAMPRMISREFTCSLGEKAALRPFLEAWRGSVFTAEQLDGFDMRNILGAPCLLQIIHGESGYERIATIMKLPKQMEKPTPATELLYVDFDDANFLDLLGKLPDWIKDKVKASPQYSALVANQSGGQDDFVQVDDDELPF